MGPDRPAPRLLRRAAALVAAGCALVHLPALLAAPNGPAPALAAVAGACLLCAVHLWRRGSTAAWSLHVVLTSAMLLHATGGPGGHHHGAGSAAWTGAVGGALAVLALLLAGLNACWLPGPAAPQSAAGPPEVASVRRVPQA